MLSNQTPIPFYTLDALESWALDGDRPGGFLYAFLSNDLNGAFRHADGKNVKAMKTIYMLVYNYMPAQCWGSPEVVEEWRGIEDSISRKKMEKRFETYRKEHYETA